jgi:aminopeptidase YwaD
MDGSFASRIAGYMDELCAYPDRRVGGPGNRAATELATRVLSTHGFDVDVTEFDCIDWEYGDAWLEVAGERFALHVGPYSLPADLAAPLASASTIEELESEAVRGAIVVLHGELAKGQLMPRNFTFYNPDSHKRVYRALDDYAPAAVVAATGRDLNLVGSQYPFNLFEDGDLDVPNAYMKDVDGERLLAHAGQEVRLSIDSTRIPSTGEHVVATRAGDSPGRVVVFAHVDSKQGSPGALDNAAGVATQLGLAELLADVTGGPTVEIVPMNGEDDYANPGEMLWVGANEGRMDDIVLGINVDDAGRLGQTTEVSFYDVPAPLEAAVRAAMETRPGFGEGEKWFMSDHAIFGIYGRPAIAVASSDMADFMAEACHTERDTLELADMSAIAEIAGFLRDVIASVSAG